MSDTVNPDPMPSDFRYKKVYEKGKPVHKMPDAFTIKHPPMDLSKRAKIFSPFDALKGFDDELARARENAVNNFPDETVPPEEYP